MAKNSKIEWTDHTANLWWGCSKITTGCKNCYALNTARMYGKNVWGENNPRKFGVAVWNDIAKYQKDASALGKINTIFVGSMMDIFEDPKPLVNDKGISETTVYGHSNTGQLRDKFFNEIVPKCPNLMFLLLTKRPSNINKYIPESWKENPPKNVMFGTSPVNQETALDLIIELSKVNGKKFISVEPQVDKIDLMAKVDDSTDKILLDCVDWVINGGESGNGKRPFDCDWARIIRDDCKRKGVPYFFKQIDKVQAIPEDLMIRQFPK